VKNKFIHDKDLRKKLIIQSLLSGPKTIKEVDQYLTKRLKPSLSFSEATRNRDIKELRKEGYEITVQYQESREPLYFLNKTFVELGCETQNLSSILELLNLGIKIGLLQDEHLQKDLVDLSQYLKINSFKFRIDGLRRLVSVESCDINSIQSAIQKKCSITFKVKQLSDGKEKLVTGYPIEIFYQDKFLYLAVKRKGKNIIDYREFRLDRFVEASKSKYIVLNHQDIDPGYTPIGKKKFLKVAVYSSLRNFFDPSMHGLKKIEVDADYDLYEGEVYKPSFRIIKDFLAFLPYIRILGDAEIKKEFEYIISKSFDLLD
jgi:hypothetical protein